MMNMIYPSLPARRESPRDDLISILVEAEIKDEAGASATASPTPKSIPSPCSCWLPDPGTTWKQMGITLAALLQRPEVLAVPFVSDRHS